MSHIVGDAIVHHLVNDQWSVTSVECPEGLARLHLERGVTKVVVADTSDALAGLDEPSAFAAAACTADGELVVMSRHSPPAIVIDPTGCRVSPAGGAERDSAFPDTTQRFLLLSCSAFENMSEILVEGMTHSPTDLVEQDPEELLLAIFEGLGHGAGAVIDRQPDPTGARP